MSAEALQRLRRVRRTLEQARAVAGAEATLVRLGAVTSLQEAVEQLRKVGNANFRLMDSLDRPLQLELGPMPFWNAVDEVLDAAALDVNYYVGQTGEIGLVQRDAQRGPRTQGTAYAGVFRLEATSVSARRNFRMPAQNGLSVGLEIAWEPRLTPVGLTLPLEEVVAECEDGQLLRPEKGQLEVSTNSSLPFSELSIQFPLPIETPRRLKTLRGVIRSLLPGANDHFRVPLAMPHEPESAGDLTFWVESVRANGTLHEVRVEVVLAEAAYAFESHRQWVFDNPAYVMGDDGQRLEHLGYQTYRQSASGVGIAYLFDFSGKLEGKTFHYQSPVSMVEKTHTFELTDIDLP
jgi:hypothetical protein